MTDGETEPAGPSGEPARRTIRVMGVLNVTPDSFSDGGQNFDRDRAIARGLEMVAEGADVIDVGGESTRPGAEPVDPHAEAARVIPVIEHLAAAREQHDDGESGHFRISIDTRNSATARLAVAAGVDLINDVSASLWHVAAECGVGWVAMHMLGDPRTMQKSPVYGDVVDEVRSFLVDRAGAALEAGVSEVWIDPGIGFGKTTRHNLELLARLDELVSEGFPVLIGTSRKRFLGELTGLSDAAADTRALAVRRNAAGGGSGLDSADALHGHVAQSGVPVTDRLEASVASAVWAMSKGATMVRVHDVRATAEAVAVIQGSIPER
ncbi:MAG: dihydropteroate synthase [Microthrixaceae bacterium]